MENKTSAFENEESIYGKEIKSIPKPAPQIGIDPDSFYQNIMLSIDGNDGGVSSNINLSQIENFSTISNSRDQVYTLLDTMASDSKVAAILESYATYATETNDDGRIMWVDASDSKVSDFISYLLDTLQVDKHLYGWTLSLAKYGDLYLRLYRESEYDNAILFGAKEKEKLNEKVLIKDYKKSDKFVHYLEAVPNPAEVFELTKFGKTQAFIKTNINVQQNQDSNPAYTNQLYRYSFKRDDVEVYEPNMFVHACVEDTSSRTPEVVEIFRQKNEGDIEGKLDKYEYTVRRGKSLLYDHFKVWRLLTLLENSIVLNRLTKSSIIRVVGVEVGDMPKEQVKTHMMRVKQLFEQKAALNVSQSMSEYTNPGPIENCVFIPKKGEQGTISVETVGGDPNVKDIADLDYFVNMFYGGFRIPKAYFGFTDDGAGFNGGQSLSIISSGFAKEVKRIQNTIVQALTTAIDIMLIDKGMQSYVGKYQLKMLAPTTQEDVSRMETSESKMRNVQDVQNLLSDIDEVTRTKILKAQLSASISDPEVTQLLDTAIQKMELGEELGVETEPENTEESGFGGPRFGGDIESEPLDLNSQISQDIGLEAEEAVGEETTELPSPEQLGIDMTQNEE